MHLQSTVQQLIGSLMTLGSFLSALVAGYFGTYLGRKPGLWVACLLSAVAAAIQIGTTSKGVLYFGRLLLGLANGFLVTFSTVYTSEAAPPHLRGVMVALFAYWVNFGSIIGSLIVNYTSKRMDTLSYRIPLACLYIVPTLLSIGLFFVPESPRWLMHRGREEEAKQALAKLRDDHGEEFEVEWAEMMRGMVEEKRLARTTPALDMFRGMHDVTYLDSTSLRIQVTISAAHSSAMP
jgi:MFS family permease